MRILNFLSALVVALLLSACQGEKLDFAALTAPYQQSPLQAVPLAGKYGHRYQIAQKDQELWLNFAGNQLTLSMQGQIQSQHTLTVLSYEPQSQKLLAYSENGVALALFIEQKSQDQALIYLRQFKAKHSSPAFSQALKDAAATTRPPMDDLNHHGWQQFDANAAKLVDNLPFSGTFITEDAKLAHFAKTLTTADGTILLNDAALEKWSYYPAEQRLVGKIGESYVLIFFAYNPQTPDQLGVSLSLYDNNKYLYTAKRQEIRTRYWHQYHRQLPQNHETAS